MQDLDWNTWYDQLVELAIQHRESVADADAWCVEWEKGLSPEQAFYDEFPIHKAKSTIN